MKKIILILLLMLFLAPNTQAVEGGVVQSEHVIAKKDKRTDVMQIRSILGDINRASNRYDTNTIKGYYTKDFVSFDGFDYETYFKMIDETFKAYPDIKYKSKIKKIEIKGDWATVEMSDTSLAKVDKDLQNFVDKELSTAIMEGDMRSDCNYVTFFKKTPLGWKIYSDNIITEETIIRYGEARKLKMRLLAPLVAYVGEDYTATIDMEIPKEGLVLASINREEIVYPLNKTDEVFRKLPESGVLERVVRANKQGINEYSIASIGITKLAVNTDQTSVDFLTSGMAFLMRRTNVLIPKDSVKKPIVAGE